MVEQWASIGYYFFFVFSLLFTDCTLCADDSFFFFFFAGRVPCELWMQFELSGFAAFCASDDGFSPSFLYRCTVKWSSEKNISIAIKLDSKRPWWWPFRTVNFSTFCLLWFASCECQLSKPIHISNIQFVACYIPVEFQCEQKSSRLSSEPNTAIEMHKWQV